MIGCARLLEQAGFETQLASSLEDAIHLLHSLDVALVLTEIDFSDGQDGLKLTEFVQRTFPLTPVVMMSGYDSNELEGLARDSGATKVLHKPFTAEELISCAKGLLG